MTVPASSARPCLWCGRALVLRDDWWLDEDSKATCGYRPPPDVFDVPLVDLDGLSYREAAPGNIPHGWARNLRVHWPRLIPALASFADAGQGTPEPVRCSADRHHHEETTMGLTKASDPAPHDATDPGRPATPMDQYDRYLLPDPTGERGDGLVPFTRASTVKGRIQNSEALKAYNDVMLAKGLAMSPDLTALVASTPLGARGSRDVILDANEQARIRAGARAAANLGSALHAFTEQIDRGEPVDDVLERVPENLKADVRAYVAMLAEHGLTPVPELVERIVVNTKLQTGRTWDGKPGTRKDAAAGVAARFDRMYRWTDPADGVEYLVCGDLKTGRNAVEYGSLETCVQEAIAARADWMWNEDAEAYEDMPPTVAARGAVTDPRSLTQPSLRTDFGLLIHLPVGTGTCNPEELDLELGWELAELAVRLMLADKAKAHCHRPFSGRATRTVLVTPAEPEETGRMPLGSPETATKLAEVKQQRATERAAELVESADTLDALLEAEPLDVAAVEAAARREAEARELAPLARDVGAARGCSQCGRTGHRANSKRCLGVRDPDVRARKAIGIVELRKGPMTGRPSAGGPIAYVPDDGPSEGPENGTDGPDVMETVPVPDGVIACGPDGAITELTPDDAATVQAFADQLKGMAETERACPHAGGFTRTEDDRWVCAECGQETERAADARRAREAMDNPGPQRHADAELVEGVGAVGPDVPVAEEPDPFAEPVPAEERTPEDRIRACTKREELSELRKEGRAAGWWTDDHTRLGLEVLRSL